MMELRLILIDDENPDRTSAYRFSMEQIQDELILKYDAFSPDPIGQMKAREKRRDLIVRVAALLGRNIADFMNDRDGFNGERRQDTISAIVARGIDQ